ncbi:hypothetical protein [Streptomyces sp. NPDC001123]
MDYAPGGGIVYVQGRTGVGVGDVGAGTGDQYGEDGGRCREQSSAAHRVRPFVHAPDVIALGRAAHSEERGVAGEVHTARRASRPGGQADGGDRSSSVRRAADHHATLPSAVSYTERHG